MGQVVRASSLTHARPLGFRQRRKGSGDTGQSLGIGRSTAHATTGIVQHAARFTLERRQYRSAGGQVGRCLARKRVVSHRARLKSHEHRVRSRVVRRHVLHGLAAMER